MMLINCDAVLLLNFVNLALTNIYTIKYRIL